MLNSKLEKVIYFVGTVLSFCILSFLVQKIPMSSFCATVLNWTAVILVVLVSRWLYRKYLQKRNLKVAKKIDSYYISNDFEACLLYIDNCIKQQKHLAWLKAEKANTLALCGQMKKFENLFEELKAQPSVFQSPRYQFTIMHTHLFNFLKQENAQLLGFTADDTLISRFAVWVKNIDNRQQQDIIKEAEFLYSKLERCFLYKSMLAMILAKEYTKMGDVDNFKLYACTAEESAPSEEVRYYVKKLLEFN